MTFDITFYLLNVSLSQPSLAPTEFISLFCNHSLVYTFNYLMGFCVLIANALVNHKFCRECNVFVKELMYYNKN